MPVEASVPSISYVYVDLTSESSTIRNVESILDEETWELSLEHPNETVHEEQSSDQEYDPIFQSWPRAEMDCVAETEQWEHVCF